MRITEGAKLSGKQDRIRTSLWKAQGAPMKQFSRCGEESFRSKRQSTVIFPYSFFIIEVQRMELSILIPEILGTVAFSASGAMIGVRKNMDLLGIAMLGLVTAAGGGVIRDLVLGIHPPMLFRNPIYAVIALVTAIVMFFPSVRRFSEEKQVVYNRVHFFMDTIGLAVFTVAGIRTAYGVSDGYSTFLLVFVGVITGVGGGVLRDVLAGEPPYIFVKHVYACASIGGALVCALLWDLIGETWAMVLGAIVVVVIRVLAARYKWSLPHPKD